MRVLSFYRAVDVNLAACQCTKQTLLANHVSAFSDVVNMDLVSKLANAWLCYLIYTVPFCSLAAQFYLL